MGKHNPYEIRSGTSRVPFALGQPQAAFLGKFGPQAMGSFLEAAIEEGVEGPAPFFFHPQNRRLVEWWPRAGQRFFG